MKKLYIILIPALFSLACTRELMETEAPEVGFSITASISSGTKLSVDAAGKTTWDDGDEIGVFWGGEIVKFTLSEGAGTADGVFTCDKDLRAKSLDGAAVYPYNEASTLSDKKMTVVLPSQGSSGYSLPAPMAASAGSDGVYVFRNVAALLRIQYTNLPSMAEYVVLTADKAITGSFTLDNYLNSHLKLTSGTENNTVKAYLPVLRPDGAACVDIPIPEGTLSTIKAELYGVNGQLIDTQTTEGKTFTTGTLKPLEAVNISGDRMKLEWVWDGGGSLPTFRSNIPAIDDNGNVYVSTNEGALYKLDAEGRQLWRTPLPGVAGKVETSPSVEKDGSTVYMAGGQDGFGALCALNSDGSVKWTFEDWPWEGASASRNFWQSFIGVGSDYLYVPVGTLSTILTLDKTTGKRICYGTGKADGTKGGLNGPGSGCAIGLGGTVSYMTTYGAFSWSKNQLDNPTYQHVTYGGYALWGYQDLWPEWGAFKYDKNGVIAAKKGSSGEDIIISCAQESKGRYDVVCYPASFATANTLKRHDNDSFKYFWRHQIGTNTDNAAAPALQDQGGIVMGHDNLVCIVPMKYRKGANDTKIGDGGLYSIWVGRNAKEGDGGTACWRVTAGGNGVSGAAAVDNNGNVHFAADAYYYIIQPNTNAGGSYKVLAQISLKNLLLASGLVTDFSKTGVWSSVKIAKGGKIYLNVNLDNKRAVTCCLSYPGVTGPDETSSWPQKAADQYNSCNQQL